MATENENLSIEQLGAELAASERNAVLLAELNDLKGRLGAAARIIDAKDGAYDAELALLRAENHMLREESKAFSGTLSALEKAAVQSCPDSGANFVGKSRKSPTKNVRSLRVAGIMDEFTGSAFGKACELLQLSLSGWDAQLEKFKPDVLVVESAWRGNSGQWTDKVHRVSPELVALVRWFKNAGLPTVFWNKEDPVHYGSFISTASLFDYVFTTDLDSVERYKSMLNHNSVYLMPFFCEPLLHSPVQEYNRQPTASFAGAYYARYPDRQKDFDSIMTGVSALGDVAIFDRNFGSDDPAYLYPEKYRTMIKGGLPYADIARSYKGYDFGVNLNSVKESQSMFARRVFDLILCDTHVVSNYSRGLRLMFGDLVISSDDAGTIDASIQQLMGNDGTVRENAYAAYVRHLALRKVLAEHTTTSRLEYLSSKIWPEGPQRALGGVTVICLANSVDEVQKVVGQFENQVWAEKKLVVLIADDLDLGSCSKSRQIRYIPMSTSSLRIGDLSETAYTAFWVSEAHYGSQYLSDAMYLMQLGVSCVARDGSDPSDRLGLKSAFRRPSSSLLASSVVATHHFAEVVLDTAESATQRVVAGSILVAPSFDFAMPAQELLDTHLWDEKISLGMAIDDLLRAAEEVPVQMHDYEISSGIASDQLLGEFPARAIAKSVWVDHSVNGALVRSELEAEKHAYIYARTPLDIDQLNPVNESVSVNALVGVGIMSSLVVLFLDDAGARISSRILAVNTNHEIEVPLGTAQVHLGLRVQGSGVMEIRGFAFAPVEAPARKTPVKVAGRHLVLTNVYPSHDDLYRNAFVHSRVRSYRAAGIEPVVFCLNSRGTRTSYEFEGVDVIVGDESDLASVLDGNDFSGVLVHFLDAAMWSVLQAAIPQVPVIVWVHGAEVQPWHRRDFNFENEDQRTQAKAASESRMTLWRDVFGNLHPHLHFVFVSKYFASEVMEDVGIVLPNNSYSVIHNFIDTDIFDYIPKDEDARFKLLSIRPFASRKYANDLTVDAILHLRDHPLFGSAQFKILGDGPLFDSVLEPLRSLDNVTIERGFLTQDSIARVHKEHGIFLTPTRMDSQGVSRDEAMSSGLVPVTNAVTAIPEFVDEESGILAPGDDAKAMAQGIADLWEAPERFKEMSAAAARRVRQQTAFDHTMGAEIRLIRQIDGPQLKG
ncbi:glycosyltransferase [Arthrobacter sp. YD2]|uniref:glycosyltransferase family protein n=1 Tax=Arthrobacter sp. YD2 TaxID=3058046 RepID=UPI0025B3B39B|nr:glycosyltransferase [Arthrobacter sp. YD2]MDN3904179.1 glycosyltransferase [Arthrobacter sp. YD2]